MNIQKFLKKNKQICCIIAIIILYFLFKNINRKIFSWRSEFRNQYRQGYTLAR